MTNASAEIGQAAGAMGREDLERLYVTKTTALEDMRAEVNASWNDLQAARLRYATACNELARTSDELEFVSQILTQVSAQTEASV